MHQVQVDEALVDYMLAIVEKTRTHDSLAMGDRARAAPRRCSAPTQALAVVEGRDYAIPDDVKRMVVIPVFAHRVAVA